MARVARATSIPIATGERLTTKYEFARVLETGAASILQMNLGRVGGLLEAKKIAGMAEAHYAQIAPHLYCGPVVGAANIQLAACTPNFLILEGIGRWDGIHAELLKEPIRWEDGYVIPPTAPGLGIELDEAVAPAHPYDGTQLHLEPDRRARCGPTRELGFVGLGNLGRHLAASVLRGGLPAVGPRSRPGGRRRLARRRRGARPPRPRPLAQADARDHLPAVARRRRATSSRGDGMLDGLRRGGTWIDMSTNDRARARAARGARRRARHRDARVPGHRRRPQGGGGRDHRLAGGDEAVFAAHRALLEAIGGRSSTSGPSAVRP